MSDTERQVEDDRIPSAGEQLRLAREAKGLSLSDAARATRLSKDNLEAFEAMQTDHMSNTIARMQARDYARFLGLPSHEIAEAYAARRSQPIATAMPEEVVVRDTSSRTRLIVAGAVAAMAIVAVSILFLGFRSAPEANGQLAVSARIAPLSQVPEETVDYRAVTKAPELSIRAKQSAWIEVRGSDGTVFRNRMMSANEVYFPRTGSGWTITVQNAGAFDWQLGNELLAPLGEPGEAAYSLNVDEIYREGLAAQEKALVDAGRAAGDAQ